MLSSSLANISARSKEQWITAIAKDKQNVIQKEAVNCEDRSWFKPKDDGLDCSMIAKTAFGLRTRWPG